MESPASKIHAENNNMERPTRCDEVDTRAMA